MQDLYPIVELIRLEEHAEYGTFGFLRIQKRIFCATLEPPDYLNASNKSSIPAQQYWCHRIVSPKFGETFEVKDVPMRTTILFHAGNIRSHTKGCIILGQHHGRLGKNRAVLNSGETFSKFMNVMNGYKGFHLTIAEHY